MAILQSSIVSGNLNVTGSLTVTGSIEANRNDIEQILNSYNSSAGSPRQFYLKHLLGNVELGNDRGNLLITTGSVGINTNATQTGFAKFVVRPATNNLLALTSFNNTGSIIAWNDAGTSNTLRLAGNPLVFTGEGGGGAEHVRIDGTGNVGIGTTNPSSKLHISGSARIDDDLAVNGGDITSTASTFNLLQNSNRITIGSGSNTSIRLGGFNSVITSSFMVYPINSSILLERAQLPGERGAIGAEPAIYFTSGGLNNIDSAIYADETNFQIATNKDLRIYAYSGSFDFTTYALTQDNSTKAISIGSIPQPSLASVYITGSSSIRLDANAISLNTNGNPVSVTGSIIASSTVRGMSSLFAGNQAGTNVEISPLSMRPVVAQTSYSFFPNNLTNLIIGGSTVNLGFNSTITSSIKFSSGRGIDFSNTSEAPGETSEIFDDYEEGTWTPAFSGSTGAGSFSYLLGRSGTYTKIGNMVYISGFVDISSIVVAGSGNIRITGLPFNVANTEGNQFHINIAWTGVTLSINKILGFAADAGSWIDVFRTTGAVTNSLSTAMTMDELGTGGFRFSGFYRVA
jgi:hypothetical protein